MRYQKANTLSNELKTTASEEETFIEPPVGPPPPGRSLVPEPVPNGSVVSPFGPFGARIRYAYDILLSSCTLVISDSSLWYIGRGQIHIHVSRFRHDRRDGNGWRPAQRPGPSGALPPPPPRNANTRRAQFQGEFHPSYVDVQQVSSSQQSDRAHVGAY